MKCVIGKEALIAGLQMVQNVVASRTTLPILGNALLVAENGKLTISTTDLDMGIRASIPCEVIKPGTTTLPAKRFFSNQATIRAASSYFKILGLPAEDFPAFPKTEGARQFKMTQGTFRDMLRRTAYAISNDESRYVLNGVFLSFHDTKLTMVATDGRRLALVEHEMEFAKGNETDAILPTKAVNELQRILGQEEPLTISLSDNQIAFDLGETFLVSKLVEGKYPNYKQVIPPEAKDRIIIERELLLNATRRVSLLSNDKTNSIRLSFSQNNLDIMSNTPEVGEAKESIPVNYKGKEFSIAFNPTYLQDPLRHIDSDEIFFDFIDELSPGVIKYSKPFLYVIMPMRTA